MDYRSVSIEKDPHKYGVPSQKKFPMPDAAHVRSAIRFFNYVDPAHEKELARAILKRMKEYGLTFNDFTVGDENRFSKYIPQSGELVHHGILGQKWGVRRFQNPDGTLTSQGKKRYSFNERMQISKEHLSLENQLRNKYLNETKEFKKYSKLIDDLEEECLTNYGFRPDTDRVWVPDEDGFEYEHEPSTSIEKAMCKKMEEYNDGLSSAARVPNDRAVKEAKQYIDDKYGDSVLDQINKDNNIAVGTAIVSSMALAAVPFILVGAGIHGIKKLVG